MNSVPKYICIVLIFFTSFSYSQKDEEIEDSMINDKEIFKMIDKYLEKANDKQNSKEEKKSNLSQALYWSSKISSIKERKDKRNEIGLIFYRSGDYGFFKKINDENLEISLEIKDSTSVAKCYSNFGSYFNRINYPDSAFFNFNKSHQIYSKLNLSSNDLELHGAVLHNMAVIQRNFKDYVGSEASSVNAIGKFERANTEKSNLYIYYSYNNLGIISSNLGNYDSAIENYQKALEYAKKLHKGKYREIQALNNIGVVFKNLKEYNKAIENYSEALENEDILHDYPRTKAILIDNITYAKFLSGEKKGILEEFLNAKQIRDSIKDNPGLITSNIHIAEFYKSIGDSSKAKPYALKGKEIAESIEYQKELQNSLLFLSEITTPKEGLKYLNSYIKLNDSIQNLERMSRDKFARIRFETDQIEEQNLQISRENEILVVAVLGLTALFLLIYIIFRQQQSNKELLFAQAQQESNQEIYRLLLNQQVKLEEGRQLEQQRMSEELHDGVLGRLFGVRLSLDGINQRANDGFTEARNKYIEELKAIEKEIRLISHDLGTETLSPEVAYIDAVESLISDLCEAHKIDFEFKNDENIDWEEVDDLKKVNLFRILQESLQNIFKHAKAKMIKINFEYVNDKINLIILDDGIGFKSTKVKRGIGLKNITSRVSQMSGVVDFISNKDAGTTVSVSVPI